MEFGLAITGRKDDLAADWPRGSVHRPDLPGLDVLLGGDMTDSIEQIEAEQRAAAVREAEEEFRAKLKETESRTTVREIFREFESRGIRVSIGACGCCHGPWIKVEYAGETIETEGMSIGDYAE